MATRDFYDFFLFTWSVAHPDLHSFPTRRSSDLPPQSRCSLQPVKLRISQKVVAHAQEQLGRRLLNHRRDARQLSEDRKSTRLNSSHANISYAVFCLKKKKNEHYVKLRITDVKLP